MSAVNHIGLICPTMPGHLNPMITLGRELKRRGYAVSVIGPPDGEQRARASGLGHVTIGARDYPIGSAAQFAAELGRLSGIRAFRYVIEQFTTIADVMLREAPCAIANAGVNGLLIDQVFSAANLVADKLRMPYVTLCGALMFHHESNIPPALTHWPYATSSLARFRNKLAYRFLGYLARSLGDLLSARKAEWKLQSRGPLAVIAPLPAGFDFPRTRLPGTYHYTGPIYDEASREPVDFPYERLTGKPLVYASMGTLQNRLPHVFPTIAAACAGLDVQLVISLGNKDREIPSDLAGSPLVVPYAPQLELVKRASLVITHGGPNTVLETLSQGVPMVAIPIANDQPGTAARLKYVGAGEMIKLSRLNTNRLREAVQRVLTDARYRQRAQAMQEEIRRSGGIQLAVDIAERALTTGLPVSRDVATNPSHAGAESASMPAVSERIARARTIVPALWGTTLTRLTSPRSARSQN